MTEEEIIGTLAAATGAAETEIADILKADDGATTLSAKFDARFKSQLDNGDKRATKKTRSTLDKEAKAAGSKHVFDESLSFDENVKAHLESIQEQVAATSGTALTEEQVLKHPAAVKALNTLKQTQEQLIEAARNEERQKLADKERAFTQQQTEARVRAETEKLVDALNPNFTKPAQRTKLIDDLVKMGGYQLGENGAIQLVDADGNLLDGKMGNPAQFADRVRDYAEELYGIPTATPRTSPGLTAEAAASAAASAYNGPKEQAAYDAAILSAKTPEERKALREGWEKYQAETKS